MSRVAWALVASLALAGCVVAPPAPETAASPDPRAWRHWTATGRMAIAAGSDGGSGSFTWEQDDATTRLDLRGPLGAGALRLTVTPETLSLADGAGRVLDAAAARAELQARLGADLPWDQFRYWMLGVAAPDEAAVVQDADAAPWRVIEQSGWRLAYDSFVAVQGARLPQRLAATRGAVRVRLIVDAWSPADPGGAPPEKAP